MNLLLTLFLTIFEIFAFKVCRLQPWPFSLYRTVFEIFDYKVFRVWPWPLTVRGHLRSKIFLPFESPYITSYLTSIDTFYLVPFLRYLTSKFLVFDLDLWPLEVTWGQKYFSIRKPIYDFLSNFYWHFLSRTVFEIFDFKDFRVWPWPKIFFHSKAHIWHPI